MAVAGGAGCGLIVLLEFLLIAVVVQGIFTATVPDGLRLSVKAPARAQQDRAVAISLQLRNEGEQPFTVRSVTVRSSTSRRFILDQFRPAPLAPKASFLGTDTWAYNQQVAPGKSWKLQLQATPRQSGKLRGTLEIQVDRGVRQANFTVDVAPAPANAGNKPHSENKAR